MISLKPFLDQASNIDSAAAEIFPQPRQADDEPGDWKGAWRALLFAAGDAACRALPPLAPAMNQELSSLARRAAEPAESMRQVRRQFNRWADEAGGYYGQHQAELKEIVTVVAKAAESIGQRDDRYAEELSNFAARLRMVADQTDLPAIRRSILESAGTVNACVARMAREGKETVRQLQAQSDEYRQRMEEAERLSTLDALTGVANRRGLDRELARRIAERKPFFVTMLDLDRFKDVNDRHGHPAGDDLLRQLSAELASQFPAPRLVARMGGDEFVVVCPGPSKDAEAVAVKIRSWVLGKYRIMDGHNKKVEVTIQAALGSTSWDGSEPAEALLTRADDLMYQSKARAAGQ